MNDVVITVRGEHEMRRTPEEAVARLTIRAEGPERGAVVERIAALGEPVRDDLAARKAAGGLVEWSSQRVSVWSERPWSPDGKQLARVHHASVEFSATFTDFAALSWWVGDVAERDGVQVDDVAWRLTRATSTELEREVAVEAARVAVERATAYASALGLSSVIPLEIADVGLLTSGRTGGDGPPLLRAAKAGFAFGAADSAAGAPAVDFSPADIVVSAAVEARFAAR